MAETKRVQMDLSETSHDRLSRLRDQMEASSYADVMRTALTLLDFVVSEKAAGAKFYVAENGKEPTEVIILV